MRNMVILSIICLTLLLLPCEAIWAVQSPGFSLLKDAIIYLEPILHQTNPEEASVILAVPGYAFFLYNGSELVYGPEVLGNSRLFTEKSYILISDEVSKDYNVECTCPYAQKGPGKDDEEKGCNKEGKLGYWSCVNRNCSGKCIAVLTPKDGNPIIVNPLKIEENTEVPLSYPHLCRILAPAESWFSTQKGQEGDLIGIIHYPVYEVNGLDELSKQEGSFSFTCECLSGGGNCDPAGKKGEFYGCIMYNPCTKCEMKPYIKNP